jgi:RNA polymerase-binding transcription factor DksA
VPKPIRKARASKSGSRASTTRSAKRPAARPSDDGLKPGLTRTASRPFHQLLLRKRQELVGDVAQLEGEAFRKNRQDAAGDLSTMPIHMADLGTDNFEQDVTLGLIESEEEELREIDAALDRIKKGAYGRCETCSKMIPKPRLKVIPYARLCVECKKRQEEE